MLRQFMVRNRVLGYDVMRIFVNHVDVFRIVEYRRLRWAGRYKDCIQSFGAETSWNTATWKTKNEIRV